MLKEMVIQRKGQYSSVPLMLAAFGGSALMSQSEFAGVQSTLACALAAAVPPSYSAAVFAGGMLSCLVAGNIGSSAVLICALLLVTAGKWIMKDEQSPVFCGGIAAISTGFSGLIFSLLVDKDMSAVFLYILIALINGVSVYFLYNISILICTPRPLKLDHRAEVSVMVVYMLFLTVLCSVELSIVNAGRIVGVAVLLCAAKRFKYSGGVVFGVLAAMSSFLASPKLGIPAVFLGVSGLAAGFFSQYSKTAVAVTFLTVNFFGQLLTGLDDAAFFLQADAVLGSILFMLIPEKLIMYGQVIRENESDGGEQLVRARMEFVAGTLVDVRKNMEGIIKCLEKNTVPFNTVNEVSTRVCGKCRNKMLCWETNFEKTNACFLRLEKQTSPSAENFPGTLDHCSRKAEIVENFLRCRKEEAINKMLSARLNDSRSFLFSQIETTEGILSSLSDKMNFSHSKVMTNSLCAVLDREHFEYSTAIAYFNKSDRLIAEVYTSESENINPDELAKALSSEFCVPMEAAEPVTCGGETRLRFSRATRFSVTCSAKQKSADENQPSGDSWGFFEDGLGYAYVFISDGMGSGKQAALDSAIVSRLFKRLICSGLDCGCAVKMLNSIMMTKSENESFATLDIARIDLETCELTLFKSGAASTLIGYPDAVMMFNSPSAPIGILHDSGIFSRSCTFAPGDTLVMLSDGVDESLYLYIKKQLLNGGSTEEISDNICRSAEKNSNGDIRDDITVAVLRAEEKCFN